MPVARKVRLPFFHKWRALKWGYAMPPSLDCRECVICGRFEVYAYGSYHKRSRDEFADAWIVPA